ncbi:hypothetical protein Tco_1375403 [Tanacetum coccineum]
MSDSEDSIVTYTQVSSPFEDSSDVGSPGVDGPPVMPEDPYAYIAAAYQALPSPDYMPGPEEPQSPPPLDFEEPEADDDEVPEEDLADYPADRDDDDEEEEEEPSGDDADDEDEDKNEDEEEEHPALADFVPPIHRMTARISIRDEPSISLPPREEIERLLALTTPPPSPLTPLSSPLPQIPSPPLPVSPPASVLPALPLPTSSPPLQLLSSDRRADYGFVDTVDAKISQRRAEEVGYRIRDAWVDPRDAAEEVALTTLEGVNTREALVSWEAWGRSIEVSYMARSEIMALRSIVMSQQTVISQLQAANRRSQTMTAEMLQADHMRQVEIAALWTFDRTQQEQLV